MILDNYEFKLQQRSETKSIWRCTQADRYKCKAKFMSFGKTVRIKSSVPHTHGPTFKGDPNALHYQAVNIEYSEKLRDPLLSQLF